MPNSDFCGGLYLLMADIILFQIGFIFEKNDFNFVTASLAWAIPRFRPFISGNCLEAFQTRHSL